MNNRQIFSELNNNCVSILVATVITAVFYNVKNDFISRGYFEEFRSVVCKSALFAAILAVYELLRRDAEGIQRGIYIVTVIVAIVIMLCIKTACLRHILNHITKQEGKPCHNGYS